MLSPLGKPLMLIASAGSGKTLTMTCRIIHMLQSGVMAKHICVVTFTRKAANEIRERVRQVIRGDVARQLTVTTFHGFALRLIQLHAGASGRSGHGGKVEVADAEFQRILVREAVVRSGVVQKEEHGKPLTDNYESNFAAENSDDDGEEELMSFLRGNQSHSSHEDAAQQQARDGRPKNQTNGKQKSLFARPRDAETEKMVRRSLKFIKLCKMRMHRPSIRPDAKPCSDPPDASRGGDSENAEPKCQPAGHGKDTVRKVVGRKAKSRQSKADEAREKAAEGKKRWQVRNLIKVYSKYEKLLLSRHAVDFSDLIPICLALLKCHPNTVLRETRCRYQHVLVDEFQDANQSQIDLLQLISGEKMQITVCGDDDQQIYGWRALPRELLYYFATFSQIALHFT